MSYREQQHFYEHLRLLRYPHLAALDSQCFQSPNFQQVAQVLHFVCQKLALNDQTHPNLSLTFHSTQDRLTFLHTSCSLIYHALHIKLNLKHLYRADLYAVKELEKVLQVFCQHLDDSEDVGTSASLDLTHAEQLFLQSLHKNDSNPATELLQTGEHLLELLELESDHSGQRSQALQLIQLIEQCSTLPSTEGEIESAIRRSMSALEQQYNQLEKSAAATQKDLQKLGEKVEKKALENQRLEKRLTTMRKVQPAYMDEYRQLETQLKQLYMEYTTKSINVHYIETQLQHYSTAEQEQLEEHQRALKRLQHKLKAEEMKILRGEQAVDEEQFNEMLEKQQDDDDSQAEDDNIFDSDLDDGSGAEDDESSEDEEMQNGHEQKMQHATKKKGQAIKQRHDDEDSNLLDDDDAGAGKARGKATSQQSSDDEDSEADSGEQKQEEDDAEEDDDFF